MDGDVLTYIRIKETTRKPAFTQRHLNFANKAYHADGVFYGAVLGKMFGTISKNILDRTLQGYNCTVFAYGQTGSGKTYTMQGSDELPGIIPRTLIYLHERCERIKVSFIEIYNETMSDLLEPQNVLTIREDPNEGVVVDNLAVISSGTVEQSLELYTNGVQNRRSAATKMNENSSRSHTVFIVNLESSENNLTKRSKLCLVDLAGSERLKEHEPERAKETCNINKSLLCLGKIVNKLSSRDRWHVSYRDSKLTFLLKDSLGGNSRLAIIGNICTESQIETINTLQFLHRSKMICNSPSINYDISKASPEELVETLKILGEENQVLQNEIESLRERGFQQTNEAVLYTLNKIKDEMRQLESQYAELSGMFTETLNEYFRENRAIITKIARSMDDKRMDEKENFNHIVRDKHGPEQ